MPEYRLSFLLFNFFCNVRLLHMKVVPKVPDHFYIIPTKKHMTMIQEQFFIMIIVCGRRIKCKMYSPRAVSFHPHLTYRKPSLFLKEVLGLKNTPTQKNFFP